MELVVILIIIIFIALIGSVGLGRAISFIPGLVILGVLFMLFGYIVITFFPLILIYIIYRMIKNRNNPDRTSRTYYYNFRGSESAQGFEEFFRQNFQSSGYSNGNTGSENYYQNVFDDKNKYYETLGIGKEASQDEIKKAYRELAKKHHPDKFVNETQSIKDYHEKKFKELNEAYEKLRK